MTNIGNRSRSDPKPRRYKSKGAKSARRVRVHVLISPCRVPIRFRVNHHVQIQKATRRQFDRGQPTSCKEVQDEVRSTSRSR